MEYQQLVNLFVIEDQFYAIPINFISRVVRAVEITEVPSAPDYLLGIVDYHGSIVPVLNLRNLLKLTDKEIDIDHRIMFLDIWGKQAAIVVDRVYGIISLNDKYAADEDPILYHPDIKQIVSLEHGIVFLLDFEQLLKHSDEQLLNRLIQEKDFNPLS